MTEPMTRADPETMRAIADEVMRTLNGLGGRERGDAVAEFFHDLSTRLHMVANFHDKAAITIERAAQVESAKGVRTQAGMCFRCNTPVFMDQVRMRFDEGLAHVAEDCKAPPTTGARGEDGAEGQRAGAAEGNSVGVAASASACVIPAESVPAPSHSIPAGGLRECPFCGEVDRIHFGLYHSIDCENCGATVKYMGEAGPDAVRAIWNRRPAAPAGGEVTTEKRPGVYHQPACAANQAGRVCTCNPGPTIVLSGEDVDALLGGAPQQPTPEAECPLSRDALKFVEQYVPLGSTGEEAKSLLQRMAAELNRLSSLPKGEAGELARRWKEATAGVGEPHPFLSIGDALLALIGAQQGEIERLTGSLRREEDAVTSMALAIQPLHIPGVVLNTNAQGVLRAVKKLTALHTALKARLESAENALQRAKRWVGHLETYRDGMTDAGVREVVAVFRHDVIAALPVSPETEGGK